MSEMGYVLLVKATARSKARLFLYGDSPNWMRSRARRLIDKGYYEVVELWTTTGPEDKPDTLVETFTR